MKIITPIFLLTILLSASCDPPKYMKTHDAYWYVKNHTDRPLKVLAPSHASNYIVVNAGDSSYFYAFSPGQQLGAPPFDLLLWNTPEQDRHIDILNEQDLLLKSWKYTDKDVEGRQLFRESCWRLYTRDFEYSTQLIYMWVFDIYPEDINLDE